jgi:hypothetical protein
MDGNKMKNSEILRAAKAQLKRDRFICIAINSIGRPDSAQNTRLMKWVQDLLEGRFVYESWLTKYYPEWCDKCKDNFYLEARQQWMDWMIQYWESKGN